MTTHQIQARIQTAFATFGLLFLLTGCSLGRTNVLFVTKSNVGLEASTKPPTFELDISRKEGVVEPQFENGNQLPVMASFKFKNTNLFAPHIGSAFATGDAAKTLAGLYADPGPSTWDQRIRELELETGSRTRSELRLTNEPTIALGLPAILEVPFSRPPLKWLVPKPQFQSRDVRPVFFGTDTSLGLKIAWSGMAGGLPDSAKLGYNRKELALAPVALEKRTQGGNTSHVVRMPSLLATVDTGVSLGTNGPAVPLNYIQYFATGEAATLLALQRDVRAAMLARMDPNQEAFKARFTSSASGDSRAVAMVLLRHVHNELDNAATRGDAKAAAHVQRLNALPPADFVPRYPVVYGYGNGRLTKAPAQFGTGKFTQFQQYYSNLSVSIDQLKRAIADPALASVDGTAVNSANRQAQVSELLKKRDELKDELEKLDRYLAENAGIIQDALNYFFQ